MRTFLRKRFGVAPASAIIASRQRNVSIPAGTRSDHRDHSIDPGAGEFSQRQDEPQRTRRPQSRKRQSLSSWLSLLRALRALPLVLPFPSLSPSQPPGPLTKKSPARMARDRSSGWRPAGQWLFMLGAWRFHLVRAPIPQTPSRSQRQGKPQIHRGEATRAVHPLRLGGS